MKKFKVEKVDNEYILSEVGGTYTEKCTIWYEKKTDKNHVKLPKDNPSGRTYIRQDKVDLGPVEFDQKTESRTGLSSGGWKSKMTEDERIEVENLEKRLDEIKSLCQSRTVEKVDPNSEEGIQLQIEKLKLKLSKIKGQ